MINTVIVYLLSGMSIGTTLALLPSPLLALLINETLKYGKHEGIKISLVPSMTDLPVITVSVFILSMLEKLNIVFGLISIAGFIFLSYLGLKGLKSHGIKTDMKDVRPQSIRKGIITNLLNPNPYIFWFTVGTPMIISGWKIHPSVPAFYITGFFGSLIGIRVLMSILINRSRKFINSRGYIILSRILSIVLILFGIKLLYQGIMIL
ncbi:MAG TPA: LysE family transporter, partial [Spirochaetota bacterium]|nr:LysE family transporter [Spirochaetota bacterium]